MLKVKIILFLTLSYGAYGQLPCERKPDSTQLLQDLTARPTPDIYPRDYSEGCNVTERIKSRILQVLQWQWPESELELYLLQKIDTNLVNRQAKGNHKAYDSLLYVEKNKLKAEMNKNRFFTVRTGLTLIPGKLYIREAIPILEKAIYDPEHYNVHAVKLSLARMGNQELQKEIIRACFNDRSLDESDWLLDANKKTSQLMFVSTQESIARLAEFMDTSKFYYRTVNRKTTTKSASDIIWLMSSLIQNDDFKNKYYWAKLYDFNEINNEVILFCRDWLLKNKGKYKLNKDFVSLY